MALMARGLSSIPHHLFCYTAISSSAIIGILPGYLIRTCISYSSLIIAQDFIVGSSLELASKNMFCGSIRMVYALIYTLLLVRTLVAHDLGARG